MIGTDPAFVFDGNRFNATNVAGVAGRELLGPFTHVRQCIKDSVS